MAGLNVKFFYFLYYVSLLVICEFGIDGQGQRFGSCGFGYRKVPAPVTQASKALLQVQWYGVIDFRADRSVGQPGAQRITLVGCYPDDKLMVNMPPISRLEFSICRCASSR